MVEFPPLPEETPCTSLALEPCSCAGPKQPLNPQLLHLNDQLTLALDKRQLDRQRQQGQMLGPQRGLSPIAELSPSSSLNLRPCSSGTASFSLGPPSASPLPVRSVSPVLDVGREIAEVIARDQALDSMVLVDEDELHDWQSTHDFWVHSQASKDDSGDSHQLSVSTNGSSVNRLRVVHKQRSAV